MGARGQCWRAAAFDVISDRRGTSQSRKGLTAGTGKGREHTRDAARQGAGEGLSPLSGEQAWDPAGQEGWSQRNNPFVTVLPLNQRAGETGHMQPHHPC